MKSYFLLPLVFLFITISSCSKTNSSRTFYTSTQPGAYLNCYVNGAYYNAGGYDKSIVYLAAQLNENNGILYITALDTGSRDLYMDVYDTGFAANATFTLNNTNYMKFNCGSYTVSDPLTKSYATTPACTGFLTISLDTLNKQVSGTFAFKAYSSLLNDSVDITNGQFKIHITMIP